MITKIINSTDEKNFELNLNQAIEIIKKSGMEVIDIKFSSSSADNWTEWSALIVFNKKDKGDQ